MQLPVSVLNWTLASLPIAVLLILLVSYRWGVAEASPIALGISLITGAVFFGGSLPLLAGEVAKGIWSGVTVMAVVVPAILIFEVTSEAKAFDIFRLGMQKFSPNELLRIVAVGWVFASFLQGVTGFGVPVAIVAPLLIGMGVKKFWAVTLPLIGHAWACTFGTLAVAWEALVFQTQIAGEVLLRTAFWAAIFTWLMNFAAGFCFCWFYAGRRGLRNGLPAVAAISLLHGGGQLILSQYNQVLCNFIMSSSGLVLIWLLGRTDLYNKPFSVPESPVMDRSVTVSAGDADSQPLTLRQAFLPYCVLLAVTLTVLLIQPVKQAFSFLQIGFSFPQTATAFGFVNPAVGRYAPITVFTHSGMFLFIASCFGYFYFRGKGVIKDGGLKRIFTNTMDKAAPATIAVILLIAMSRVMGGTGQVLLLAQGAAAATGRYYGFFAPFIGVLGAFMTSSNMASNILFGNFQLTMSELLNLSTPLLLGAQTGGGAIGNVICPGNVLLGTTTAGILGSEGEILKVVMVVGLIVAAICGIVVMTVQAMS